MQVGKLDQNEIDQKVQMMQNAHSAEEKVGLVYQTVTGMPLVEDLSKRTGIQNTVNLIESFIKPNDQYYEDFKRLKLAVERRWK